MIEIYTDGSSKGNPGKGGYGIIILFKKSNYLKEFSEGFRNTTNNRMELFAVIEALKKIKSYSYLIHIYSDSKYVVNAINNNWILKWKLKNFYGVKNSDLWKSLIQLLSKFNVKFFWLKGHSNNIFNQRVDTLAVKAAQKKNLKIDSYYENSIE